MASLGQNISLLYWLWRTAFYPVWSYIQPFIIMSAIPFGFVGAVGGHMIMGFHICNIHV